MTKIDDTIFEQLENKILEKLREKFIMQDAGNAEKLITSSGNTKLRYYCKGYDLNLYQQLLKHKSEYQDAPGEELKWKMAALRSSSALILNTLGDGEGVKVKKDNLLGIVGGEYNLKYEQPLRTIVVAGKNEVKNAYIDALLQRENLVVLIENKMLEYLPQSQRKNNSYQNTKNYIGKSYFDIKNYVGNLKNSVIAKEYCDLFTELNEMQGKITNTQDNLENYDILQIVKHSLGFLTEYLNCDEFKKIENVKLVNSIWRIDRTRQENVFNDEKLCEVYNHVLENEFYGKTKYENIFDRIKNIYNSVNLNFDFGIVSWSDFKDCFDLDETRLSYLQRYEI